MSLTFLFTGIIPGWFWTDLELHWDKRLGEKVSIFGGSSINLNIAENKESFIHTFESTFAPYDMFSHVSDNHTVKGWIRFTLGIRFDK